MSNHVLWLLSYIGLSLALTYGNRQTITGSLGTDKNHALLTSVNLKSLKSPSSDVHDWFVYDKHQKPNNMLLLDDILSALLGNIYKQKQSHQLERMIERIRTQGSATSHLLNFFYDMNGDKLKKKEKKERTLAISRNDPRTMLKSGKPYSSATMYVEALAPMQTLVRSRFDRTVLNENLDLSNVRSYRINPSVTYDSEAALAAAMIKSPGKRSRISSNGKYEAKELHQQQESPVNAVVTAGSNVASQFILRSARGNRQYDVPQIECPLSDDGMERFACPTADRMGRYRCIDDHVLCDGFIDCPMGEDEDRQACMFYKTTKAHLDVLADALLRWARGR